VYQFSLQQRTDAHGNYLRTAAVLHSLAGAMASHRPRTGAGLRLDVRGDAASVETPVSRLAERRPMNGPCRFTNSRRTPTHRVLPQDALG